MGTMTTTRLEYRKGSSRKFWEIDVRAAATTVRFGRIGKLKWAQKRNNKYDAW